MTKSATVTAPTPTPKVGEDLSYLLKTAADSKTPIQTIDVAALDEKTVSLGIYPADRQPRGFVVAYEPNVDPGIVSKLVAKQCGSTSAYEIVAFIANYSHKTVNIKLYAV